MSPIQEVARRFRLAGSFDVPVFPEPRGVPHTRIETFGILLRRCS